MVPRNTTYARPTSRSALVLILNRRLRMYFSVAQFQGCYQTRLTLLTANLFQIISRLLTRAEPQSSAPCLRGGACVHALLCTRFSASRAVMILSRCALAAFNLACAA